MNSKRMAGIVAVAIGVIMLFLSNYINKEVAQGRKEIKSGQKKVNQANDLFSLNPLSEQVGKGLTSGAQNQIDQGKIQADYYAKVASFLQIGGIVVIILGGAAIIFCKNKGR